MVTGFSVFLDACVLVPNWLRDILLTAAQFELYRPLWSPTVLDEMERALIRRIGVSDERAKYTRSVMESEFRDIIQSIGATAPNFAASALLIYDIT